MNELGAQFSLVRINPMGFHYCIPRLLGIIKLIGLNQFLGDNKSSLGFLILFALQLPRLHPELSILLKVFPHGQPPPRPGRGEKLGSYFMESGHFLWGISQSLWL